MNRVLSMNIGDIAKLAALELKPEEAKKIETEIGAVFSAFQKIQSVNTDGVEPLIQPFAAPLPVREDKAQVWDQAEAALKNAPDSVGNLFKVPPVI